MKLLLLSAFCIAAVSALAQNDKNNGWRSQRPVSLLQFKGNDRENFNHLFQEYLKRRKDPGNLLANRQGNIVLLPQDRMPCIVPDSKNIAPMPNAWSGVKIPYQSQHHLIPNLAIQPPSLDLKYDFNYNWVPNKTK